MEVIMTELKPLTVVTWARVPHKGVVNMRTKVSITAGQARALMILRRGAASFEGERVPMRTLAALLTNGLAETCEPGWKITDKGLYALRIYQG